MMLCKLCNKSLTEHKKRSLGKVFYCEVLFSNHYYFLSFLEDETLSKERFKLLTEDGKYIHSLIFNFRSNTSLFTIDDNSITQKTISSIKLDKIIDIGSNPTIESIRDKCQKLSMLI